MRYAIDQAARGIMFVYLAGPMTGLPLYNFAAFAAAREWLRNVAGFRVICPAEMDLAEGLDPSRPADEQGFDYLAMMRRDLEAIATPVDGVVFLPGFAKSAGALAEYELARALGTRLFTLSGDILRERTPDWMDAWVVAARDDSGPLVDWIEDAAKVWTFADAA